MNAPHPAIDAPLPSWPGLDTSRIPFWAYTREDIYRRELERFFYKSHWCYVGLEAEVPKPGDFVRTVIGERSVIMVRDADGRINVVENRCAHRGMRFCRAKSGNAADFVCPYHQWNYNLKGELQGVPLKRGVRQDGQWLGGMPADFKNSEHNLTVLRVAMRGGVVFASFDANVESFKDFMGETMLADNKSQLRMDPHGRHAAMISTRGLAKASADVTAGVASFKASMTLNDDRFLDVVPEAWWGGPSAVMMTLFPSVIFQQQVNSVSTRHIQPRGPNAFDFVWTHFGFEDDTPEMTRRRLRQANLFGPAGFVSADDGEVIEFSQQNFRADDAPHTLVELGGRGVADTEHQVTETLIRGMYAYWRRVMEI